MQHSTTAFVGLRYLRAGHGSGFVSFVTVASVLGVASVVKIDLDECHDGDVRYR